MYENLLICVPLGSYQACTSEYHQGHYSFSMESISYPISDFCSVDLYTANIKKHD